MKRVSTDFRTETRSRRTLRRKSRWMLAVSLFFISVVTSTASVNIIEELADGRIRSSPVSSLHAGEALARHLGPRPKTFGYLAQIIPPSIGAYEPGSIAGTRSSWPPTLPSGVKHYYVSPSGRDANGGSQAAP